MRRSLLGIGFGLCTPISAYASVVINEFLPDPASTDAGHEWIEITNTGGSSVDISGWTIEVAVSGSSFSVKYTFPLSTTIAPGQFLTVGDSGLAGVDLNAASNFGFGNAGSNSDGIRLRSGSDVIDSVVYGDPNSEGIWDDTGAVSVSLALTSGSGMSLGRIPDGADTNASGADFAVMGTPSPGATNGVQTPCNIAGTLKINEFSANPDGTDTDHEWIELYNPGGVTVDLTGWRLEYGTSSFSSDVEFASGEVSPGSFLWAGGSASGAPMVLSGLALGNASSNADGLRLVDCDDVVRDTVIYGPTNTDGWLDDGGSMASSLAPGPADGESIARAVDGVDTNASGTDFEVPALPTPGESNSGGALSCGDGASIVINEVFPDPDGADENREWVELYNSGKVSVDLSYYAIETATDAEFDDEVLIPSSVILGPEEYLVIGGDVVNSVDIGFPSFALPNGTHGDAVRLVDCHGVSVDTLVYGKDNEDGVWDDSGAVSDALASDPSEGESLARRENGIDTDDCELDFVVSTAPTPGSPNPTEELDPCSPDIGGLWINEVLYDPSGDDGDKEWIELYNEGDTSISLTDWVLEFGGGSMVLPSGTNIAAHGFLVIGGSSVVEADLVRDFGLENAASEIRLADCEGTDVDAVAYGDTGVGIAEDGASLARIEDGLNTGSNEDWMADGTPSPGATNVDGAIPGETDDENQPPGGGCGGDSPPGEGCGTAVAPWWLASMALAVRRRRSRE